MVLAVEINHCDWSHDVRQWHWLFQSTPSLHSKINKETDMERGFSRFDGKL